MIYMPVGDCDVCRHLGEEETSFAKFGWDDMSQPLPEQAGRLVLAEDLDGYNKENHHVKRCPVCGTYYQYDFSYEYLVNGSEDEEVLKRLTPDEASRFLTDEQYAFLIEQVSLSRDNPDPATRLYAGRSLAAHHLRRGELDAVQAILADLDTVLARGALLQVRFQAEETPALDDLLPLVPALQFAAQSLHEEVATPAKYLLKYVFKIDG